LPAEIARTVRQAASLPAWLPGWRQPVEHDLSTELTPSGRADFVSGRRVGQCVVGGAIMAL
jgi:hypothetical protein